MIDLNFPNAVTDEKDFYGREKELTRLVRVLGGDRHVPAIILGERRIGKTSLLNVTLQRLKKEGFPFHPLWVEPRGIHSQNDLARAALQAVCSQTGQSLRQTGLVDAEGHFTLENPEQFEAVFLALIQGDSSIMYLLCIDEFDEIVRNTPDDEKPQLMALLHHLVNPRLPLTLFFTMTRLPESMQKSYATDLTSRAEVIELNPWQAHELQQAFEGIFQDRVFWTENPMAWLFKLCGGHPYFAKLILSVWLDEQSGKDEWHFSQLALETTLQLALDDPRVGHVVENLYHVHFTEHEREVLLILAGRTAPLTTATLKSAGIHWLTAARHLSKRRYLFEQQQAFDFHLQFLSHWLRHWIEFEEELERLPALAARLKEPIEIEVDELRKQVRVAGRAITVSAQEFALMACLASRAGQLVDREQLVDEVWHAQDGVTDQTIDTAIFRLRRKLGAHVQYIETVAGQGFIIHRARYLGE